MVINLGPDLEAALNDLAHQQGAAPEEVALSALRERFLGRTPPIQPQDEWERRLLAIATNCGVALSHAAVSSDGLYE